MYFILERQYFFAGFEVYPGWTGRLDGRTYILFSILYLTGLDLFPKTHLLNKRGGGQRRVFGFSRISQRFGLELQIKNGNSELRKFLAPDPTEVYSKS
jgi:hypothetical protein